MNPPPLPDPFGGEYASPRMSWPGFWGLLAVLGALPGLLLPWWLPLLIASGMSWNARMRTLLVVPIGAFVGILTGLLGRRRSLGRRLATWGLVLSAFVLVAAVAVVVVFRTVLRR